MFYAQSTSTMMQEVAPQKKRKKKKTTTVTVKVSAENVLMANWCLVEVLLYVHRNRRFIRDGGSPKRPSRLSHSS